MSDLSAYGSSIQGLKEQAQSCRVGRSPPPITPNTSHLSVTCTLAAFDNYVIRLILDNAVIIMIITLLLVTVIRLLLD